MEVVTRLDELVKLVVEVKALSDKWSVLQLAAEVEAGAHSNHRKDPNSGTQRVMPFLSARMYLELRAARLVHHSWSSTL